jgi:hypothetical protein
MTSAANMFAGFGRSRDRRAFTLTEVLMALFILGVGIISIAALFPAGIAQQRRSADDVIGPTVADNALAVLRAKLRPEFFGTFDEFSPAIAYLYAPIPTQPGDWPWLRPGFIFNDDSSTPEVDESGAIDIFSHDWTVGTSTRKATEFGPPDYSTSGYVAPDGVTPDPNLFGIPYNRFIYGAEPPRILITQEERFFPQTSQLSANPDQPQYVWDCMFRRFQGRILVAIFVYRVTIPGGEGARYVSRPLVSGFRVSPIPVRLEIATPQVPAPAWDAFGSDSIAGNDDDAIVLGTDPCSNYDPFDPFQSWQESGQWLLDQNNNVHRVLSAYCDDPADSRVIELVQPPAELPVSFGPVPAYYSLPVSGGNQVFGQDNIVSHIWYVPTNFIDPVDGREYRLTPVYATVKEL